jgi:hypothetical protein
VIEYPTGEASLAFILKCLSGQIASEGSPSGVSATWGMLGPRV